MNTTGQSNTANGGYVLYSNTTGSANTANGTFALYSNTIGNANTANGYDALYNNTTGYDNTANGASSLWTNTTGNFNTASGNFSLSNNTTGSYNTATGFQALLFNTTGNYNIGMGDSSLYHNTTGNNNVAIGFDALLSNTTVSNLTALGYQALYSNTAGTGNVATGCHSLYYNSTGYENTANGDSALYYNTVGYANTATGYRSLWYNDSGTYNVANGFQSLLYNSMGTNNTANGFNALEDNSIGYSNTANGAACLSSNVSGNSLTADGVYADVNADGLTDASAFGYQSTTTASYQVRIGDGGVTSIGGYANWTNISDGRVKKNIQQNVPGLAFINQLQPVTYNLDLDAADRIVQPPVHKDAKGNVIQPSQEQLAARTAKEQIVYTGFIAQDVEKAAQKVNYAFSGVDAAKNSKDLYGLRYAEFVVPLVKAVQELSATNIDKQQQIDSLKQNNTALTQLQQQNIQQINSLESDNALLHQQLSDIKSTITQMQSAMSQCCNSFSSSMQAPVSDKQLTAITDQPRLDQNVPNPFNGSSYISYYIPQGFHSAQLVVVDISGNVLKTYTLANSGYGKQFISGSEMASGMYQYSLLIDGRLIDTKKMVRE